MPKHARDLPFPALAVDPAASRAAASPDLLRDPRGDPGGPPAAGRAPAGDPRAGARSLRLAQHRDGGVRAAARRGLHRRPGRRRLVRPAPTCRTRRRPARAAAAAAAARRPRRPGISARGAMLVGLRHRGAAAAAVLARPAGARAVPVRRLGAAARAPLAAAAARLPGRRRARPATARLCEAIADYLASARAVSCRPEQVIVVSGAQQALDLAARVLIDPGDPVWIEEPGYPPTRAVLRRRRRPAGARAGRRRGPERGRSGRALEPAPRLVCVSPSHQYPLGVTMSLKRRLELLDWARAADGFVLEDDYDSEYRYAGRPLAALQGLDRRRPRDLRRHHEQGDVSGPADRLHGGARAAGRRVPRGPRAGRRASLLDRPGGAGRLHRRGLSGRPHPPHARALRRAPGGPDRDVPRPLRRAPGAGAGRRRHASGRHAWRPARTIARSRAAPPRPASRRRPSRTTIRARPRRAACCWAMPASTGARPNAPPCASPRCYDQQRDNRHDQAADRQPRRRPPRDPRQRPGLRRRCRRHRPADRRAKTRLLAGRGAARQEGLALPPAICQRRNVRDPRGRRHAAPRRRALPDPRRRRDRIARSASRTRSSTPPMPSFATSRSAP